MDLSNMAWRKASYSGGNGGACIEVGVWRKATHRGNDGECAEVATIDTGIAVRDSKEPNGPTLAFTPTAWHSFVTHNRDS
jgi:hypothetical protein